MRSGTTVDTKALFFCLLTIALAALGRAGYAQTTAPAPSPLEQPAKFPTPTSRERGYSRNADAQITYEEGLLRYKEGRLPEAEQKFKELVTEDPQDVYGYYHLGLSQLDQNRPADAVPNFSKALQLDPTLIEVRGARATALIRLGKYDEAQQDIDELAKNPSFAGLTAYLRGQLAYAKGDLDAAAVNFAKAKELGEAEAAPAGFYEGLTYLRMRQLAKARKSFSDSYVDADRDPTLASASRQLDAVLALQQQGKPSKPWEVQLTMSYEYDSNVIQIGANIPVPEGISGKSDRRFVAQPRGSFSFIQNDKVEVGVEANGYFTWQAELSDFDVASYQGGPFINYKVMETLYASMRYGFNYIDVGHDPYATRNVVTPQLTYVEKDFGYTSGYYQFQTRQFDGDVVDPAQDRDGQTHTFGIVQGINLPEIFKDAGPTNLELSYRLDRQLAKGSDYDAYFNTIGGVFYAPLPFFKLRADFGATLSFENYDNGNSLDVNGDERKDWEYNLSVGLTRQIIKEIAVRMDYTYTDHHSNVESVGDVKPFEYDRHQFGVRLIMSY